VSSDLFSAVAPKEPYLLTLALSLGAKFQPTESWDESRIKSKHQINGFRELGCVASSHPKRKPGMTEVAKPLEINAFRPQ
jgi:hypothetical protein